MNALFDYTLQRKIVAWNKAAIVLNYDPRVWRQDRFGLFIRWSDYGNRLSEYGWEIDHIHPSSKGGSDGLHNCEALHWRNNLAKGSRLV
jgi:5-methylcytosine-specific restriction endonuclease McrA